MDLRKTLLFFVFAAFAFTFLLSFSATNYLLSPIETLTLGMNSINSGNFRHRIPVDRSDELGDVFNAFNTMARGLEEGELMELMVSDSAREAMESEETEAIAKTGKRLDATILFIGIPEFEKSLMQENPRILMEKMSLQVGCICRVILGFDGMVDKLIGDKILAYFRHDQNGESQAAEAAVNSLHEIMQTYYDGGIPFRIASGITSGKVILGLLGAGERIDHTIIGDPVNLAARAEAVAETLPDNQIVISQEALLNFQGDANIIPLDISNVKGKKAIVSLSQIILEYKINSGENHG